METKIKTQVDKAVKDILYTYGKEGLVELIDMNQGLLRMVSVATMQVTEIEKCLSADELLAEHKLIQIQHLAKFLRGVLLPADGFDSAAYGVERINNLLICIAMHAPEPVGN